MIEGTSRPGLPRLERVYDFDDVPITLTSSSLEVIGAIERMMSRRSLSRDRSYGTIAISAELVGDSWHILVDGKMVRSFPLPRVAPFVAEEIIATACAVAARRQRSILIRGAIIAKDGIGLALVGHDLESAKALALHLHARQWTAISFGYGFLNPHTLDVVGLQSLAAISSASIDQIPRPYRRAIEASQWYDAGRHLTFYAVDPYTVYPDHARSTTLKNILLIDGTVDHTAFTDEALVESDTGFLEHHPMRASIRVAKMTLGSPIATCDAIEKWSTSDAIAARGGKAVDC
jgi:hypothetical protein